MGLIQVSKLIPTSAERLYEFLTDLKSLPEILGASLQIDVPARSLPLRENTEIEVFVQWSTFKMRHVLWFEDLKAPQKISYRQISGVMSEWRQTELLHPHSGEATLLTDIVEFKLPLGLLGTLLDDLLMRRRIESHLRNRMCRIENHFARPARRIGSRLSSGSE